MYSSGSSSKIDFYKVDNIPVKVHRGKFGTKAFSLKDKVFKRFPLDLVWKKGLKINENEFLILNSLLSAAPGTR